MKTLLVAAVSTFTMSLCAAPPTERLTKDLKEIAGPGSPGTVIAMDERATPIVFGKADGGVLLPVVVAGEMKRGRAVAMGHSGYLDDAALADRDTGELVARCLRWLASKDADQKPLTLGIVDGDFDAFAKARGFSIVKLGKDFDQHLSGFDVLVLGGRDLNPDQIGRLTTWLESGGGLLAAQTGWGWQQLKGGPDMRTNPLNKLLAHAGIAWTDEIIDETAKDGFDVTQRAPAPLDAKNAIDTLIASASAPAIKDKEQQKKRTAELKAAAAVATRGVRLLPIDDTAMRPKLREVMTSRADQGQLTPTDKKPLDSTRSLDRFLLALQVDELRELRPSEVKAHPAAADYPGAVPSDAPRITKNITLDASVPGWHSLGLYAPAGGVVRVSLIRDEKVANIKRKGLSVRIGCHTDELWHHSSWKRVPQIAMKRSFGTQDESVIASPFGGLVYIDMPSGMNGSLGVRVEGAVESPLFVLGKTTPEEWQKNRTAPGPWAELACDSVIISVPSSAVRNLEDPTEICTIWQRVLDEAADLGSIPRERSRPERYVADVQISAGYMHSGYPIMTHLDAVDEMSQAAKLKAGSWGLFHELGHNHQQKEWTFEGTGEVTNNLWSLYLMEVIAGKKPGQGHDALNDPIKRSERAQKYMDTGAKFGQWKSDPFLALEMYLRVREEFGWEPFKKVFAEYRSLNAGQKPRNDQEERDQWMVRLSRAVGRNLGPYFERWGVPTTKAAKDSIADLPVWGNK